MFEFSSTTSTAFSVFQSKIKNSQHGSFNKLSPLLPQAEVNHIPLLLHSFPDSSANAPKWQRERGMKYLVSSTTRNAGQTKHTHQAPSPPTVFTEGVALMGISNRAQRMVWTEYALAKTGQTLCIS